LVDTSNERIREIEREIGVIAHVKKGVVIDKNGPHNGNGICEGFTGGEVLNTKLTGPTIFTNNNNLSAY